MNNNQPIQSIQTSQTPPLGETLAPSVVKFPKQSRRKVLLLILIGIGFITITVSVYYFYSRNLQKAKIEITSWHNLKPGISTQKEVTKTLGPVIEEKQTPLGRALLYQSDNKAFPHTVILDKHGKLSSMFIQVAVDKQMKFSEWTSNYGQPEKEMYNSYSPFTKTYVFPQKGVAVVANKEVDLVYAIHYFELTSLQNYLSEWGEFLSEKNPYKL